MTIRELAVAADWTAAEVRNARSVAAHAAAVLDESGDEVGAEACRDAARMLARVTATVVVCGEYRSGKSALIGAMLGARVIPDDPFVSTPVPVRVHRAPEVRAAVRVRVPRDEGATALAEDVVDRDDLEAVLLHDQPLHRGARVDHVDLGLPHPVLDAGLAFVDTPSISGGIMSPQASIVLGEAAQAAGVLFVTDASQELTAPELEFLEMAHALGTEIVVAMTKIDLFPDWRRILERNHRHLDAAFDRAPVVLPVSAALRQAAVRLGDPQLDTESGVGVLTWYLGANLMTKGFQDAIVAVGGDLEARLDRVEATLRETLAGMADVNWRQTLEERRLRLVERIELLRTRPARELRTPLEEFHNDVSYDLRKQVRFVSNRMDEIIDERDPHEEWQVITSELVRLTNRAQVEHSQFMTARARRVVEQVEASLAFDAGTLDVELASAAVGTLRLEVDAPRFDRDDKVRWFMVGRNAMGAGAVGGGAFGTALGALGLASAPATLGASLAFTAAAAGLLSVGMRKGAKDKAKAAARSLVGSYLAEVSAAAEHHSNQVRIDMRKLLTAELERRVGELDAAWVAELRSVERMLAAAADGTEPETARVQALLERATVVRAHAGRLRHRIERPVMEVPAR